MEECNKLNPTPEAAPMTLAIDTVKVLSLV